MKLLFEMDWLTKSIIGMLCVAPLVVLSEYIRGEFSAKPEGVLLSWLLGACLGVLIFTLTGAGNLSINNLFRPAGPLLILFFCGMLLGALSNLLLISAMMDKNVPNAALPFAIYSMNPVIAYLLMFIGSFVLPELFKKSSFTIQDFLGIVLLVAGLSLIVTKSH